MADFPHFFRRCGPDRHQFAQGQPADGPAIDPLFDLFWGLEASLGRPACCETAIADTRSRGHAVQTVCAISTSRVRLSPGGTISEPRFALLCNCSWAGQRDKLEHSIDWLIWLLESVEPGWPDDERSANLAIFQLGGLFASLTTDATGSWD